MDANDVELMRQMMGHHGEPAKVRAKVAAQIVSENPGIRAKAVQRIMRARFGISAGMPTLMKLCGKKPEKQAAKSEGRTASDPERAIVAAMSLLQAEVALLRVEVKRLNDDLRGTPAAETPKNGAEVASV